MWEFTTVLLLHWKSILRLKVWVLFLCSVKLDVISIISEGRKTVLKALSNPLITLTSSLPPNKQPKKEKGSTWGRGLGILCLRELLEWTVNISKATEKSGPVLH